MEEHPGGRCFRTVASQWCPTYASCQFRLYRRAVPLMASKAVPWLHVDPQRPVAADRADGDLYIAFKYIAFKRLALDLSNPKTMF
jgi:hypothetical protein